MKDKAPRSNSSAYGAAAEWNRAAMDVVDKVAWVYTKDGRVLSTRSRGKDVYYLPGGKREVGESDEACLRREIGEELAVRLADVRRSRPMFAGRPDNL